MSASRPPSAESRVTRLGSLPFGSRGLAGRRLAIWVGGIGALLLAAFAGLSLGVRPVGPGELWALLFDRAESATPVRTVVRDLRLPRVVLMALLGAALAPAGAAYQGLFRNPLADPYIVGVASGAGLGGTLVLALVGPLETVGLFAVPLGAFLGGLAAVALVLAIARKGSGLSTPTLLLAGVAVGSFATALTTFWMLHSPEGLRRAFNWLYGGNLRGGWMPILVILPYFLVGLGLLLVCARSLNVMQLDEEEAIWLGVPVERVKWTVLIAATLMTAAAVAFGGLLGFVGLVVPHVLRLLGAADYRRLVPLSALGGAAFLILADLVARTAFAPAEYPVGVVTALIGAPFFAFLLLRGSAGQPR